MFKIAHFSDSHLGFAAYGMPDRLLDFAAALDRVARVAIEQKVDLVVDTGDTFHSPEPDPMSVAHHRHFVEKLVAAAIVGLSPDMAKIELTCDETTGRCRAKP